MRSPGSLWLVKFEDHCLELLRRRPIITESTGRRCLSRHCEELLRRSNPGATTCAAPATQTVVLWPLDSFASLAMTDREVAHLFLRVALPLPPRRNGATKLQAAAGDRTSRAV